ncbi:filamentous hemagglutinin N-terminal domain-containing protein, partial [bacterium]|nr:filamentous hemagglutinin N-terminal domain-containing protein [bacterium]
MFISINEKSGFFCLRCYVIALFLCLTIIPLFSDVTSDGTTGTIINPVPFVGAGTYAITGGTIQDGTALFHSFDEFSIDQDQIAHFQNGIGIENIFSRITCGNQSWIDGEIEVDNAANLYLMNPSGFLFGSNSSLSVPGSFYITTADYLSFGDGGIFYAETGETSILSSDSVSAFGFTNPSPSGVEITGGLEVSAEEELAIIAGDIYLYADMVSGYLYAPFGYISLISVASAGVWNLTDLSSFSSLGNISISDSSWISLEDAGYGGQIYIRGNNFVIDCSNVDATTNSNDGYGNSIDIALTGKLTIQNEGGILNGTTDAGNSDEIKITAAEMELTSGGYIIQKTVDDGDCGEINLSVNGKLDINDAGDDPSGIYCFIGSDAQGSGNSMNINASEIALSIGGVISSVTNGSGDAGEIILTMDKLIMNTESYIENSNWEDTINPLKTGSSGDLTINAGSLIMSGDSYIDNSSYTSGNIGETSIIVSGDIKLNNSKIYSNVAGAGNGGDLFIRCNSMLLENGGIIDFSIYGSGQCAE